MSSRELPDRAEVAEGFAGRMVGAGLSPAAGVVLLTLMEGGRSLVGMLARAAGVTAGGMSATVQGLVVRGWVRREQERDRRRVWVVLTEHGEGVARRLVGEPEPLMVTDEH